MKTNLAKQLNEIREARGLSVLELAQASAVPVFIFEKIESGEAPHFLQNIATALDLNLEVRFVEKTTSLEVLTTELMDCVESNLERAKEAGASYQDTLCLLIAALSGISSRFIHSSSLNEEKKTILMNMVKELLSKKDI